MSQHDYSYRTDREALEYKERKEKSERNFEVAFYLVIIFAISVLLWSPT